MKLTNVYRLPPALVRAVEYAEHREPRPTNRLSVSRLIAPVCQAALMERYADELEDDVANRIWLLMGTAVHEVLRRAETSHSLQEQYFRESYGSYEVSGICDDYDASDPDCCTITDWKFTSVWSVLEGTPRPEWEQQLNIYGEFYRRLNMPVHKLQVIAVLKDWSRRKAQHGSDYDMYPIVPVRVVPVPLWDSRTADAFIRRRIAAHTVARDMSDEELPPCTPEERWQDPPEFAVMKEGNKRAVKLHPSLGNAEAHAENLNRTTMQRHYVSERCSEPTRCQDYCLVNGRCPWYQSYRGMM